MRHYWWFPAAIAVVCVCAVARSAMHVLPLLVLAVVGMVVAFALGRVHGRRRPRRPGRQAPRSFDDVERGRQVAELERLSNRTLPEILDSYRVIAGRYTGRRP